MRAVQPRLENAAVAPGQFQVLHPRQGYAGLIQDLGRTLVGRACLLCGLLMERHLGSAFNALEQSPHAGQQVAAIAHRISLGHNRPTICAATAFNIT
jgi:hypothetical protein